MARRARVGRVRARSNHLAALALVCACVVGSPDAGFAQTAPDRRIEVKKFEITGVTAVTESELKSALVTTSSSKWPWGSHAYFDRTAFDADLQRIEAFLADRGYPDARVVETDIMPDESGDAVELSVVVKEGLPVRVSEIRFVGFEPLGDNAAERVSGRVLLKPGDPLARATVLETAEIAADMLRNEGYAHAKVDVQQAPAATPAANASESVALTFAATPGVQAYFGPIEISGNEGVGTGVIRRQLTFKQGARYTRNLVEESQRKLYMLGLFQFATIENVTTDPNAREITTRVTVTERDHREVQFSVGYGTEEQVAVETWFTHLNLFGGARRGSLHGKWSWLDRGIEATFNGPAFLHPRLALELNAHGWFADQRAYTSLARGGRAALVYTSGRRAENVGRLSYVQELQSSTVSDEALADPTLRDDLIALGLDPVTGEQHGLLSAIMIEAARNTTGSPLDPTKGYMASLLVEQGGGWLPGAFNYYNVIAEGRYYKTIRGITFAERVRYGLIRPMGADSDIPFSKRYFLGGAENLRGWGRYEVAPLSEGGLPVGGHTLFLATTEVRFPVMGAVGGVVFLDGGNVWEDAWASSLDGLKYDAGVGVRYRSPVGPLRLDFGYQLTPIEGLVVDGQLQDRRWRVHFSIGQAF